MLARGRAAKARNSSCTIRAGVRHEPFGLALFDHHLLPGLAENYAGELQLTRRPRHGVATPDESWLRAAFSPFLTPRIARTVRHAPQT